MELLSESEQQTQYLIDLQSYTNFQNQLPYSPFQEELIGKSMKDIIQTQNSVTCPISRLDSIMIDLINESEESLSCQPLTNRYIPNSTDWTKESCYFGNQDSISANPLKLDQIPRFENHIDILASYPFPEIEIEYESDPEPHVGDSILLFDSIITPISLPNFFLYSRVNIESCTSTP